MHRVGIIRGDGIGPEISEAAVRVLDASGAQLEWHEVAVGVEAERQTGEPLPFASIRRLRELGVALKAPLLAGRCTGGVAVLEEGAVRRHPSINNGLRRELGLFVNVRPLRGSGVDLVIMREITEDVYSGIEREDGPDAAEAVKRITRAACERIARYACDYARRLGRRRITAIHKANVLHLTDGLFLKTVRSVVEQYGGLEFDEAAIDAACYLLVKDPGRFDVMVAPNQYGDIISDLAAGVAGSLGLAPGGNIGEHAAVFEAAHGAAPDIAGRGVANPIALILSGGMMLDHLGERAAAARVRSGVERVIAAGRDVTPDLGGSGTTASVAAAIVAAIEAS